jgi:hypothetical protein
MERRPPTPICKCFVLCKRIFLDPERKDYVLVEPTHQLFPQRFPMAQELSVFARWTNSHGVYAVEVQLRNLEGDVLWREEMKRPFETFDPLQVWILTLMHLRIPIAEPGKYEFALLANGQEVAVDVLQVHPVRHEYT